MQCLNRRLGAVLRGVVARKAVVYPLLLMIALDGPQVAASWLTLWQGMQPTIQTPTRVVIALPLVTERKWTERSEDDRQTGSAR